MRRLLSLLSILVISACARTSSDAQAVFDHAFSAIPPQGVQVVNGHLWENRHLVIFYEETWQLQLTGPNAMNFVRERWNDLEPARSDYVDNRDTPWFVNEEPDNYLAWTSKKDSAITIMQRKGTDNVFIVYVAL